MERLPYIDDHARTIAASPERTWSALLAVLPRTMNRELPKPLVSAWGLKQSVRRGDWGAPSVGDTVPGFAVAEIDPPRLLTLRGQHRFSRYELRFVLEPAQPGRVELHAQSSADFPGLLGGVYRTLVIGTRGHIVVLRHLLAQVARRAERHARARSKRTTGWPT